MLVSKGVGTVVTDEDTTIGQLEAASEDLRAVVLGKEDTTPPDSASELMVMMKRMEEQIKLLQEESVQERKKTEEDRKKTEEEIQTLRDEALQERKLKEESLVQLQMYTINHGIALEDAVLRQVNFNFYFKLIY